MTRKQLLKELSLSDFVGGQATVYLHGETIGTVSRSGGHYECNVLGEPWAGGRNLKTTMGYLATAYQTINGKQGA